MKRRTVLSFLLILAPLSAAPKQVSDDVLYDNVRRKLANDPLVKGGALDVEVKDGKVTLRGSVESEKQKVRAEKLAKKVSGVKSVVNQITVRTPGEK